MDKKLIKVIQKLIEAEVAKERAHFLENILPSVLNEYSNSSSGTLVNDTTTTPTTVYNTRNTISKNKILDDILKSTKPFTPEERSGKVGATSILDTFRESNGTSLNESNMSYIPGYESAEPDVDMGTITSPYTSPIQNSSIRGTSDTPRKTGLGVKTGLAGLDRILNRDNSELVKKFKR